MEETMEGDEYYDSYELVEPQSFAEFSKLIQRGEATEQHHKEFYLRLINHFCASVEGDREPDKWALYKLASALAKVAEGGRWEDELPLPWAERSSPWSSAEQKDLDLFCEIARYIKSVPDCIVTEVIKDVATNNNASYEKARAAYYKHKHLIK